MLTRALRDYCLAPEGRSEALPDSEKARLHCKRRDLGPRKAAPDFAASQPCTLLSESN